MQGGNRWAHHKHKMLTAIGMVRNPSDPSLYHRHDRHGFVLMDIVVVDDFKITGWPLSAVARLKAQLAEIWDCTDLGEVRYFCNIEINRDKRSGRTTLKQTQYIHDMLAKYELQDCYPLHTPCTKSIYNQHLLDPVTPYSPSSQDDYANQLGSLVYPPRSMCCTGCSISVCQEGSTRTTTLPRTPQYYALREAQH